MRTEWVAVQSTCIRRVALEGKRAPYLLRLHLVGGTYLAYRLPTPAVYDKMLTAPSKGKYYNSVIKGKFPRA